MINTSESSSRQQLSDLARSEVRKLAEMRNIDPFTIGKLMTLTDSHVGEVGPLIEERAGYIQRIDKNSELRQFSEGDGFPSFFSILRSAFVDPESIHILGFLEFVTEELHKSYVELSSELDEPWKTRVIEASGLIFPHTG